MGLSLIEMLLGLVLVYATLALLLMKVQEWAYGNVMRSRVSNLHQQLHEATQQDEQLAQAVCANPLVFALSAGEVAKPSRLSFSWPPFSRATGPSSIPPDVFARALLMELHGGTHPRHKFSTPLNFLDRQLKAQQDADTPNPKRTRLLKALHGLVAGKEASWDAFESSVALWFQDIGDRADGWFKRKSDQFAFRTAILLCVALNVDTMNMVNVLSADPELRVGLADLAEDVSRMRDEQTGAASAPAPAARTVAQASPATRVSARLADADAQLREAFYKDDAIARFGHDLQLLRDYCDVIPEIARYKAGDKGPRGRVTLNKRFASNPDAWLEVIPSLRSVIKSTVLSMQAGSGFNPDQPLNNEALDAVMTAARQIDTANTKVAKTEDARDAADAASAATSAASAAVAEAVRKSKSQLNSHAAKLQRSQHCLIQVSDWVGAARIASDKPETRKLMQDAAVALEDAIAALQELIVDGAHKRTTTHLRQMFLIRPVTFRDCREESPSELDGFLACMRRNEELVTRLPLGWVESNWRRQFCKVVQDPRPQAANCPDGAAGSGESAAAGRACPPVSVYAREAQPEDGWPCESETIPVTPGLGLHSAMHMANKPWAWAWALVGILISSFFIALGAPFWFDVLGRLVKLRTAGKVREAEENELKGRGSQPLPLLPSSGPAGAIPASPANTASFGGSLAGQGGIIAHIQGSKNTFEDQLLPREVMALQAALGVKQTAMFDDDTRDAIAKALSENGLGGGNELSLASYTALVRRPPEHAEVDLGHAGSRPARGQPHPYLDALRTNLQAILGIKAPDQRAVFNDDLRALAVLHRVKDELNATTPPKYATLDAVRLAREAPATLDQLDEIQMNRILASRTTPAHMGRAATSLWMDWAWGELGQVEKDAESPKASNPRICEYLKAAGIPNDGDRTPWCAAFVTWVLKRHNEVDKPASDEPLAPATPLTLAKSWQGWKRNSPPAALTYGDVVVVLTNPSTPPPADPKYHVGFYVEDDGTNRFWMLGGNQAEGGRVCLSSWPKADIQ